MPPLEKVDDDKNVSSKSTNRSLNQQKKRLVSKTTQKKIRQNSTISLTKKSSNETSERNDKDISSNVSEKEGRRSSRLSAKKKKRKSTAGDVTLSNPPEKRAMTISGNHGYITFCSLSPRSLHFCILRKKFGNRHVLLFLKVQKTYNFVFQ